MLKSSNIESIINAEEAESQQSLPNNVQQLPSLNNNNSLNTYSHSGDGGATNVLPKHNVNENNLHHQTPIINSNSQTPNSLASKQLTEGLLQIFEPPIAKARGQLKELIGKQNKIYIDLSAEKFKFDNAETATLHEMMNNVKIYREKLVKIKKQMQNIYQRTKSLKKRALNVQACKQKELQRKLQKQQQEEALIGKQQQQQNQSPPE